MKTKKTKKPTGLHTTVLRQNLAPMLTRVARFSQGGAVLPVLSYVRIASDLGRLSLACSDIDSSASGWIGARIDREGAVCVPARTLKRIVAAIPKTEAVDLEQEGTALHIRAGRAAWRVEGLSAEDFPELPEVEGEPITIDADDLSDAIARAAYASAVDTSRPSLTGVSWRMDGEGSRLAAADGFRLAVTKLAHTTPNGEGLPFIVPAVALHRLRPFLRDGGDVEMRVDDKTATFRGGDWMVTAHLIAGTFPAYEQLIPTEWTTAIELDRKAMLGAIAAADVTGAPTVRLTGCDHGLRLSVLDDGNGSSASVELDAMTEGPPAKIAFAPVFLRDVFNGLASERVRIEMRTPSDQGVFRPVGEADDDVHVVMPMFVQW